MINSHVLFFFLIFVLYNFAWYSLFCFYSFGYLLSRTLERQFILFFNCFFYWFLLFTKIIHLIYVKWTHLIINKWTKSKRKIQFTELMSEIFSFFPFLKISSDNTTRTHTNLMLFFNRNTVFFLFDCFFFFFSS